jgi:hypothetical protein
MSVLRGLTKVVEVEVFDFTRLSPLWRLDLAGCRVRDEMTLYSTH